MTGILVPPFLQRLFLVAACGLGILFCWPAEAQSPPSAAESSSYTGLHAASHQGDVPQIKTLIALKADINSRDPYGRTSLHVATFARQRGVIRELAKAGADLGALEKDRY